MNIKDMNVRYITDKKGVKKQVVLSIKDFESLLEDLQDLAVVAERRDEETMDHQDVIKELKKDGLI